MKKTIDELKAEIIALGLLEAATDGPKSKQVHRFIMPSEFLDGHKHHINRVYTTYESGYVRRNHWGHMGETLLTINPVQKTLKPAEFQTEGDRKQYWSTTLLLNTEEERLERLLEYLKNKKK